MNLKDQVCSLELSKRLKELGVRQESHFKYCGGHTDYYEDEEGKFEECNNTDLLGDDEYCHAAGLTCEFTIAAFTVAELGEMLPRRITTDDPNHPVHRLICEGQDTRWMITYICAMCHGKMAHHYGETEAAARAQMLIYLLENNLITP